MAALLGDIRSTLKFDEMASGVVTRFNSARDFIQNSRSRVSELTPIKSVRERVEKLMPNGSGAGWNQYLSPSTWTKYFPAAKGNKQSPVDIVTSHVQYDNSLGNGEFVFNYFPSDCMELRNTGASWQIVAKDDAQSTITAVHLPGTFKLKQIHCHWGTEATNGSEHVVNGMGYAAELHLVHYNIKYATFEEAIRHCDGLAVLGTFLKESDEDNPQLEPLIRCLSKIRFKMDVLPLPNGFDPNVLLPESLTYWTYDGSLTTPPCNECITWTVFSTPLTISHRQLEVLRQLYAVIQADSEHNPQYLVNNVRPTQPLNNRQIRASFPT